MNNNNNQKNGERSRFNPGGELPLLIYKDTRVGIHTHTSMRRKGHEIT